MFNRLVQSEQLQNFANKNLANTRFANGWFAKNLLDIKSDSKLPARLPTEAESLLDHSLEEECIAGRTLRLLSFNIQAGQSSSGYSDYLTNAVRQFLPSANLPHLDSLGEIIKEYDIVALQEVDGGSLRSGFVNQLDYFAELGDFDYRYQQLNRDLGRIGQYSNGMLSRCLPHCVKAHKLPGFPGRGAIVAKFGQRSNPLVLVGLHLALSKEAQRRQLDYVAELLSDYEHVIIMGDLNCESEHLLETELKSLGLTHASDCINTFPSWRPSKALDHILVSSGLSILEVKALDTDLSDHLPLSIEVQIPPLGRLN